MKKFTNLTNEEFFFKKEVNYTKVSKKLLEVYSKHLIDNSFIHVTGMEREKFDFSYFKVKSIERIDKNKFSVTIETFNESFNIVDEINYLLEI
jgi:hypothetical protein